MALLSVVAVSKTMPYQSREHCMYTQAMKAAHQKRRSRHIVNYTRSILTKVSGLHQKEGRGRGQNFLGGHCGVSTICLEVNN